MKILFALMMAGYVACASGSPETSRLFERRVDASGVVSFALRPDVLGWNRQSLYFTIKSMTDDGRFLLFNVSCDERKGRGPRRLACIDFACDRAFFLQDAEEDLSLPNPDVNHPFLDVVTDRLYFIDRKGLHRRDLAVDPQKDVLVCPIPSELVGADYFCTHLTLTKARDKAFLDACVAGRCRQGLLDFASGRFEPWGETDFFCNHGQICPADDSLALCAWEWCWLEGSTHFDPDFPRTAKRRPPGSVYPRMWLMDAKGGRRLVKAQAKNFATHERWSEDGRGFYWCGDGVHRHDLATGEQSVVTTNVASHASLSADGSWLVYDRPTDEGGWRGCGWRVAFLDCRTGRETVIHSHRPALNPRDRPSTLHPDAHPAFVCRDRYVVCTANDDGGRMNLSLTPVGQPALIHDIR